MSITIAERFGYDDGLSAPSPLESELARQVRLRDEARRERDEAREALRCTEATLQAVTALHVAWTELAVARGRLLKAQGGGFGFYMKAAAEVTAAEGALVKLGVPREAL